MIAPAKAQPERQHEYKPWIMKTPALCILISLAVLLIGLTEYAVRKLPAEKTHSTTSNLPALKRNIALDSSIYVATLTTFVGSVFETHEVTYSVFLNTQTECDAPPPTQCSVARSVYLPIGTVTIRNGKGNVPNTSPTASVSASQALTTLRNGSVTTTIVSNSQECPTSASPAANVSQGRTPKGLTDSVNPGASNSCSSSSKIVVVFMPSEYFLGAFFPTLISILFAIPWSVLDNRVKYMEPFVQLTKPSGAAALYTVCLEYSTLGPFGLVRSIHQGHWSAVLSSILTLLAALLAPIAAEAMKIQLFGECSTIDGGCAGGLAVVPTVARVAQGLLALMVLLTLLLIKSLWRRPSGVFSEPFSIAGVAILFHHPNAVDAFAAMAVQEKMSSQEIRKKMTHLRFMLETYVDSYGYSRYGLVPVQNNQTTHVSQHGQYGVGSQNEYMEPVKSSHPLRVHSAALATILAALLALIAYYYQNSADIGNTALERFMNSQSFGVRFLFALIGVIINATWKKIFERISLLAPYRAMNRCATVAARSVLLVPSALPVTGFLKSMHVGNHAVAFVALSTVLADILTITLANVPFSNATVYEAFVACVWVSIAILIVMILTLVSVFSLSQPDLPLKPNSLASTLSYLSGSNMGLRLADYATMPPRERNRALEELGLKYRLRKVHHHSGSTQVGLRVEQ